MYTWQLPPKTGPFLYRKVLKLGFGEKINAIRATRKSKRPVVLWREETAGLLSMMNGTSQLVAKLLYGSGLRISEALLLRVQDNVFNMKTLTAKSGKGGQDHITTFATSVIPLLKAHLAKVKTMHERDLEKGYATVYLPYRLAREYSPAATSWGWHYVFPSSRLSTYPSSDAVRRHHIGFSVVNKATKAAATKIGIVEKVITHTLRNSFATHLL